MDEVERIVREGFESTTTKMLIQEKSDEKGIANRTHIAKKLVRIVHILLIKILRRNVIFIIKLLKQLV